MNELRVPTIRDQSPYDPGDATPDKPGQVVIIPVIIPWNLFLFHWC